MQLPIDVKQANIDFAYDRDTGDLSWRTGPMAGKVAGTINSCGYRIVTWRGRKFYAHRIAAAIVLNSDLVGRIIDHRNYKRADNRMANIWIGTMRENVARRRLLPRNRELRYQGIERRLYTFGTRYRMSIVAQGRKYVGQPRRTQREAYVDYLTKFQESQGFLFMPPRLQADYVRLIGAPSSRSPS